MLKNYLKVAIRSLLKQKGLSFINIFGLSVGLACFSLFLLYALNEFTFDSFHKNSNQIFRVYQWSEAKAGEPAQGMAYNPMPLGPAIKTEFPDVLNYVRFKESWGESFIKLSNKVSREEISFADPSFFSVFSFKLKSGNRESALKDPHNIIITDATAEKLFGTENPTGKTIEIKIFDKFEPFVISGISENAPSNSSIQYKILGNFQYLEQSPANRDRINNWNQISYLTFLQLRSGSTLPKDDGKLISFRKKYYPDEEVKSRADGWTGKGPRNKYRLQTVKNIHTDVKIYGGTVPPIDPKTIWILLTIAGGLLLIACINFTTLSIGRSAGRSKEVGMRKVIGGTKKSLVFQFLIESLVLAIISCFLGLLLANILLPYFNKLSGREIEFSINQFPQLLWLFLLLILIAALLAGGYPAWILSGFKPIEVLKMKIKLAGSNFFTKSLVTIQFIVSAALIISTLVILKQLHFMQSKNPGFNKENVLVIDASGMENTKRIYSLLKNKLDGVQGISGTASAELGLGEGEGWSQSFFQYNGKDKLTYEFYIDKDYLKVLGMELIAGRNFNSALSSDTITSVIVNEALVRDFGWNINNAVGQRLKGYSEKVTPEVIGVVKDFNYLPFSQQIQPQLFQQFSSYQPYKFFIRLTHGNPTGPINKIEKVWKNIIPEYPLKYSFLDESLNRFYKSEAKWSGIVGWAGGISIFLACLGLFGLAALAVINRTKEIGIRKVLGASLISIFTLVSKDFLKLVFIAFVVAMPIGWYFMNKWLLDFPYRIQIQWWVFGITGGSMIIIALLTVGVQAMKAAIANPVKSIMRE